MEKIHELIEETLFAEVDKTGYLEIVHTVDMYNADSLIVMKTDDDEYVVSFIVQDLMEFGPVKHNKLSLLNHIANGIESLEDINANDLLTGYVNEVFKQMTGFRYSHSWNINEEDKVDKR